MRKKYIPFEKVLQIVDLNQSDVIMDVGGGDGFYSSLFSERCSKVYYVDASDPAVEMVREKFSRLPGNITILQEDICTTDLPKDLTKVFFSNSFHDLGCREKLLDRLKEVSDTAPAVILVEFKKESSIGPPEPVKIHSDELDRIFERHGYRLRKRETLQEHYISSYTI